MTIKMRSHDRTFTAPRLNYRQSTILTTPVDKSNSSSNLSSPCSVEEPYCAATSAAPSQLLLPPPAATSAVTNKSTSSYHDDDSTSERAPSLLLRKANSQSSMNLTTLLDNCQDPIQQEDIIPRPSQSAPYATSSPPDKKENDDDMDTTTDGPNQWNILQARLMEIITTTIHQELKRQTAPSSTSPPIESVSQWWQQQHVALEKMVTDQQKACTKTLELFDRRLVSLERAQNEFMQRQQQQQQQQQSRNPSIDELEKYNALHARYMDLVTQHTQQLEKYQELERAHLAQTADTKKKHRISSSTPQKPSIDLPTPNASPTTTLSPDPPHQSVKMDNGYVEFMTECNGQPVLCRVKLPKDADVNSNKVSGPSSHHQQHRVHHHQKKQTPRFYRQQQQQQQIQIQQHQSNRLVRYQPPQQVQQQYHLHRQQQQHYHQQHQQQQQSYHYTTYQQQYPDDLHQKSLNPHAPVWNGSWKKQKQIHYY